MNKKYWSKEEINLLENVYPTADRKEKEKLAAQLGKSIKQIQDKARSLNINTTTSWRNTEKVILKEFISKKTEKQLEELLKPKSASVIRHQANSLGLKTLDQIYEENEEIKIQTKKINQILKNINNTKKVFFTFNNIVEQFRSTLTNKNRLDVYNFVLNELLNYEIKSHYHPVKIPIKNIKICKESYELTENFYSYINVAKFLIHIEKLKGSRYMLLAHLLLHDFVIFLDKKRDEVEEHLYTHNMAREEFFTTLSGYRFLKNLVKLDKKDFTMACTGYNTLVKIKIPDTYKITYPFNMYVKDNHIFGNIIRSPLSSSWGGDGWNYLSSKNKHEEEKYQQDFVYVGILTPNNLFYYGKSNVYVPIRLLVDVTKEDLRDINRFLDETKHNHHNYMIKQLELLN